MGINDYIKVGSHIKELRKSHKLTQAEVAKRLNIPRSSYSNYENDKREPSLKILTQLADIFNVTIDDLLFPSKTILDVHMNLLKKNIDNPGQIHFSGETQRQYEFLTAYFAKLTDEGKEKLIEYAKDLSSIPTYTYHNASHYSTE